jgi:hypothetical protein
MKTILGLSVPYVWYYLQVYKQKEFLVHEMLEIGFSPTGAFSLVKAYTFVCMYERLGKTADTAPAQTLTVLLLQCLQTLKQMYDCLARQKNLQLHCYHLPLQIGAASLSIIIHLHSTIF